jgi:hypothetical protein
MKRRLINSGGREDGHIVQKLGISSVQQGVIMRNGLRNWLEIEAGTDFLEDDDPQLGIFVAEVGDELDVGEVCSLWMDDDSEMIEYMIHRFDCINDEDDL